jgi:hypothetical protein
MRCFYAPVQWVMSCVQWAAGDNMCHLPPGSLDAFVSAVGNRPLSRVFWSAPSPGTLAGFCEVLNY